MNEMYKVSYARSFINYMYTILLPIYIFAYENFDNLYMKTSRSDINIIFRHPLYATE